MALIDDRGRVFGRVNLIDAAAGLLVLMLVAGVYTGYRLLRLPGAPMITKIEPHVQQGGNGRRLGLRGRNFLPYLRVFVQRTGDATKAVHELDENVRNDPYTLVNYSEAKFLVESPLLAEVRLPDDMGAGVYDLVFYNETQQVALHRAAFQLTDPPPPPPPPPSAPVASVRLYGAFISIDRAHPPRLDVGLKLPTAGEPWAEIIEVQPPRPETALVRSPTADFPAEVPGRIQVPAVLRVRCIVLGLFCSAGGTNVAIGTPLTIQVGDRTLSFSVDDIGPDASELVRQALVDVRFFVKPEIAPLVHVNDTDRSIVPANTRSRRAAVLQSRSVAEEYSTTASMAFADATSATVSQKVVAFTAKLSIPVIQMPTGWLYRGQPIKAGAGVVFDTSTYVIRGTILSMTFVDAASSRRSTTP